jgi:VHL beta domain
MPHAKWTTPSRLKPLQYAAVLAFATITFAAARLQAQAAAPVDGPAGYEVACAIHSAAGYRACNELPSARSCDSEASYASRPSKDATGMTFVNRSDEPVKIYWLSFQAERILYQYLPPGGRHTQQTFVGHNWLATTLDGKCIGIYKGAPQSIAFF